MSVVIENGNLDCSDDEIYLALPSLYERLVDYKHTLLEVNTLLKKVFQYFQDYLVPESAVMDRLGHRPKGRLIQMRLYSLSKRHFALVFISFIVSFLLTTLAGLAGPAIIITTTVNSSKFDQLDSSYSISKGPFDFASPAVTKYHQQIWLFGNIHIKNPSGASYVQVFQMEVLLFGLGDDGSSDAGLSNHTHTRTLSCQGDGWCDPVVVLHLGYPEYSRFRVKIIFIGLDTSNYPIDDVSFDIKSYNPVFTQIEIWFRFSFLVATFLVTCIFAHFLRHYHLRNWTIEQKWLSILLPLLLLYNDPIFPLSFLVNSWIPGMVDAIFQATFLCALLMFWLCVYHGIQNTSEKRPLFSFYLPKLLICGLLWLAAVTLGSWQQYNELLDPSYQYKADTKNFTGMKVFFFIMGGVYLLYLGFLVIRACTELHAKPYANLRLKFLTAITVCVLAVSIAFVFLRFGTSVLQDNFVADISTKYQNSSEFVCFYSLLNFYIYTMAFVYSPSNNVIIENEQTAILGTLSSEPTQDSPC
ncbi:transmembrane protein 181-like isoform X2 [Clavelina lepadiformis]|uniref:transmembrane protein 181-like isoform X2 n=1 Tax=Clavelina lepadiformis TaxID=159417 RepID=UPI0040426E6C